jgi:5'-3' exonuclease
MTEKTRWYDIFLDVSDLDITALEPFGTDLAVWSRGVNWWIGDVARAAERRSPENWSQVFPEWVSPGHISRCMAVAKAYPNLEDRHPLASWSIHRNLANDPDRKAKVQAHVDEGHTSDEAKAADKAARSEPTSGQRWLLAIDCNYFLHRQFFSGAGVESAQGVASWIARTVERLKEKGLTDVACCFDGPNNHRRELTDGWEDGYKSKRTEKEPELKQQLNLVRELLEGMNFACVSMEGMEADDMMASYAVQFPGRVTLFTQDKDARQSLSEKCNILSDVEWEEDETSSQPIAKYKWITAKAHTEDGCTYNGVAISGIPPELWCDFQALAGDSVDGITGVKGVGAKIAADLIKEFGSAAAVIEAAKAATEKITAKKREAIIEFAPKLETTMKLVRMRTDLELSAATRV